MSGQSGAVLRLRDGEQTMIDNIRGQIAKIPEEKPCYCRDPKPHWHTRDMIFDGERWVDINSQAGIDLVGELTGTANQGTSGSIR